VKTERAVEWKPKQSAMWLSFIFIFQKAFVRYKVWGSEWYL
jgi:hypothetical protein